MDAGYLTPPPALSHLVQTIWFARGVRAEFDRADPIVPDGCVELVFNFGAPFEHVDETGRRRGQPRDLLVGPSIRPTTAVPTGEVDLLGLRCWPGRTSAFFGESMQRLEDQLTATSNVLGGVRGLIDRLAGLPDAGRIQGIAQHLSARAERARQAAPPAIAHALHLIARRRGAIGIGQLATMVGVSRRQLERQFRDQVGLSAKQMTRISRVHHALRALQADEHVNGSDVAALCGYTDQAHLIRDCRELTGTTPTRLAHPEPTFSSLMRQTPRESVAR